MLAGDGIPAGTVVLAGTIGDGMPVGAGTVVSDGIDGDGTAGMAMPGAHLITVMQDLIITEEAMHITAVIELGM